MTTIDVDDKIGALRRGFEAQSIAVVGASTRGGSLGGKVLTYLKRADYQGAVTVVHPSGEFEGWQTVRSLEELAEPPDLVVVTTPAVSAPGLVRSSANVGAGLVVVQSAGFAEAGEHGERLQREMRTATGGGCHVVGPNGIGILRPASGVMVSATSVLEVDWPTAGRIAVVSQSGSVAAALLAEMVAAGLGISHWISVGNEMDIEHGDALRYLASMSDVDTVLLYVESARGAAGASVGFQALREAGKHVFVLKSGRSLAGGRAAQSHTAAAAGNDALYDAFLRSLDVPRVETIRDLVNCAVLCSAGKIVSGDVAIVTPSGGFAVMAADAASTTGVSLAKFRPETEAKIRDVLPSGTGANPVDTSGHSVQDHGMFRAALEAVAGDPGTGTVVLGLLYTGYIPRYTRDVFPTLAEFEKTLPASMVAVMRRPTGVTHVPGTSIPIVPDLEDAMRAIAYVRHGMEAGVRGEAGRDGTPATVREEGPPGAGLIEPSSVPLPEWVAFEELYDAGLPMVSTRFLRPGERLDLSGLDSEFFVVKALVEGASHKTELGYVHLNVSASEVSTKVATVSDQLGSVEGLPEWRIAVQPQVDGPRVELMVSVIVDDELGAFLGVGPGGIFADLLNSDTVFVPVRQMARWRSEAQIHRFWSLLQGWRGAPSCDLDALDLAIEKLCTYASSRPGLRSVELNPLLVGESGVVGVDAVTIVDDF